MNRAFAIGRFAAVALAALVSAGAAFSATYHTDFSIAQDPISEGGKWHHSASPWKRVRTISGFAIGKQTGNGGLDDSYALLSGFTQDQGGEAIVRRAPNLDKSCSHEVEILLRMTDTATTVRGYEVLFPFQGPVQIVRWEGPFGQFTPIGTSSGVTLKTGDRVRGEVIGDQIVAYYNDVIVAQATDGAVTEGQPGIGFFRRACGTNQDLAFNSYDAYDIQSITVCTDDIVHSHDLLRAKLLAGPTLPGRTNLEAANTLPHFDGCTTYYK